MKTTPKPKATKNRRGELLPPLLDVPVEVAAPGETEVGVCESVDELEGVAMVVWGAWDVACWAARSTTYRMEVLI